MRIDEFVECMEMLGAAIPRHAPKNLEATAALWFDAFAGLSTQAFMQLIRAAQMRYDVFPSLKEMRELVTGNAVAEADAIPEIIWACLNDYGSQTAKLPRIKERLGDLGWQFVERLGGWQAICNQAESNDQAPTLKAQWRNAIKAMLQAPPMIKDERSQLPENVQEEIRRLSEGMLSLN